MAILDNPGTRIGTAVIVSTIFFAVIMLYLPNYPIPEDMVSAVSWLFDSLWDWDFMIPFSTLVSCFSIVLLLEGIFVFLKLVMWFKKHLTQQH